MSIQSAKFSLTINSYAERAQLANRIKDECSRAEKGEKINPKEIVDKLDSLVRAMNNDLIAIGKPKTTEKLHREFLAHKNDLNDLTARVNALSSKANSVPAWVKPVGFATLAVAGLAITALTSSQYAPSTNALYSGESNNVAYWGVPVEAEGQVHPRLTSAVISAVTNYTGDKNAVGDPYEIPLAIATGVMLAATFIIWDRQRTYSKEFCTLALLSVALISYAVHLHLSFTNALYSGESNNVAYKGVPVEA